MNRQGKNSAERMKGLLDPGNKNNWWKGLLKKTALVFLAIFIVLSLLPYLLPQVELGGDRYDLVYSNSNFSQVRNIDLHYRIWESGGADKGNILLVHGFGASTFSWRYTAPYLQERGYRVLAVDLPGFGLSERVIGFDHSADNRADLLWVLLDQLYPGEKWHLVGHSMGGATVSSMALMETERCISLTLAAGALAQFEPSLFSYFLKYPPASRWIRVIAGRQMLNEERVEMLLISAYGREPEPAEIEGYYLPLTVENSDAVLADLIKSAPTPLLNRVSEIRAPVLLIWGENDTWVPLNQGIDLEKLIPGATLVVLESEGHCPMETAPGLFNYYLQNFLEK